MKKYIPELADIFTKAFNWFIALSGLIKCEGNIYILLGSIAVFIIMEYLSQVFLTSYVRENIDLYVKYGYPKIIERNNRKVVKLIFRNVYLNK